MEQLISEIEQYAARAGMTPQTVLRRAIRAGGTEWASWVEGRSSPTLRRADLVRAWMAANPPAGESAA